MLRRAVRSHGAQAALAALLAAAATGACGHDELAPPQMPQAASAVAGSDGPPSPSSLRMYVLGDSQSWRGGGARTLAVVALGGTSEGVGAIQDGLRIVASASGYRAAAETTDPPLVGGRRLPPHLGGGFLFETSNALYTSPTFDGPLRPLVTLPDEINTISFGPQGILVRGNEGGRWYVDVRTGAPAPMSPPGLVDIASLPDGRAAALTEFGFAMISTDAGAHWQDVTHQLPAAPTGLEVVEDELYIDTAAPRGDVVRVDAGGTLASFDKTPTVEAPVLRPRDPRWNDRYEPPIRHALRLGVAIDDRTALVVDSGNIDTVDVLTGELLDVASSKLPPDATCEGLRAQDDILLVCKPSTGPGFVASHVLSDKPIIEQTFATEGIFYGGDDGGLAFGGPCSGSTPSARVACVRTPGGSWQEVDLEQLSDAGAQADALRWIPRGDGDVVAVVNAPKAGVIDGRTGELRAWDEGANEYMGGLRASSPGRGDPIIDRAWTFTPSGTLRGWVEGGSLEIALDGALDLSPFKFDHAGRMTASGPYALAVHEGRFWQTTDRGLTWVEVAPPLSSTPPSGPKTLGAGRAPRMCSAVGCDLTDWYRIGWAPTPPSAPLKRKVAAGAPHLVVPTAPSISCQIEGALSSSVTPRTDASPDDLGLGSVHAPIAQGGQEIMHSAYSRTLLNPPHATDPTADPSAEAVRLLLGGYGTTSDDGDRITVLGPNKDPMALKRLVSFVAPFDVTQQPKKGSYGLAEIVAAGRSIGLGSMDVLADDPSVPSSVVPVLGVDPAAASDLLVSAAGGMLVILRANGAKPRVAMRVRRGDDTYVTSAAAITTDELALLDVEDDGTGHVMRWTPNGVADLFDVPAPPSSDLVPANPDAIAIGPRGEVAVLRTASGGTPSSEQDPALLYGANGASLPLAPWSTMALASDPACRALAALPPNDPSGGWRAVVQTTRPWVSVTGAGLKLADDTPALMRVRWTQSRVCLEAIEARLPDAKLRTVQKSDDGSSTPFDLSAPTWLVARFAGAPAAVRSSVMLGSEQRQPLVCTK